MNKSIDHCLDGQLGRHGEARRLRTDNRANLGSKEVEDYLKKMGVEHRYTTPLWQRANDEVEKQNRTLLSPSELLMLKERIGQKGEQFSSGIQINSTLNYEE